MWVYGSSVPAPQHRKGWLGLHEAVVAPISLLEADLISQLVTVGVELAHLALGLQRVRRGSVNAAGDKGGTRGVFGGSWGGAEPASLPSAGGCDPSPSRTRHYLS